MFRCLMIKMDDIISELNICDRDKRYYRKLLKENGLYEGNILDVDENLVVLLGIPLHVLEDIRKCVLEESSMDEKPPKTIEDKIEAMESHHKPVPSSSSETQTNIVQTIFEQSEPAPNMQPDLEEIRKKRLERFGQQSNSLNSNLADNASQVGTVLAFNECVKANQDQYSALGNDVDQAVNIQEQEMNDRLLATLISEKTNVGYLNDEIIAHQLQEEQNDKYESDIQSLTTAVLLQDLDNEAYEQELKSEEIAENLQNDTNREALEHDKNIARMLQEEQDAEFVRKLVQQEHETASIPSPIIPLPRHPPSFNLHPRGAYPIRFHNPNAVDVNMMHDGDEDDYESLLEIGDAIGHVKIGLKPEVLHSLPLNKVQPADTKKECQVCKSNFEKGEELRRLPCLHDFHKECIDPWLKDNNTCPVCRVEISVSN